MKTQRQAILEFLKEQSIKVDLYTPEMEVQVNVIDGPNRDIKDKKVIWSNETDSWSSFRIPYNTKSKDGDVFYTDKELGYELYKYVEGIGLTGWNYITRCSEYVGFDFDSILSHTKGLSEDELDDIRERIKTIPWLTLRRSKSGKGYHLYCKFSNSVPTSTHAEHSHLAKFVLSQLSGLLNFDFESKVDKAGGVLWIWHRKASKELKSFEIIKAATEDYKVPENWKSLTKINVKNNPASTLGASALEELLLKTKRVALDDEHRRLLTWFANKPTLWWWDAELSMLVCHTKDLEDAHKELGLKGIFDTIATGRDRPNDQNCFGFPSTNGSWVIRRHGQNTKECNLWTQDSSGWTRCDFNKLPNLLTIAKVHNGVRTSDGKYVFEEFKDLAEGLEYLNINLEKDFVIKYEKRKASVHYYNGDSGELVVRIEKFEGEPAPPGWASIRGPKLERIFTTISEDRTIEPPDDIVRYTVKNNEEEGWFIKSRGNWIKISRGNVKPALITAGCQNSDIDLIIGQSIFNHWEVVNLPFENEYPGNRRWNRDAIQLATRAVAGECPTWNNILDHAGKSIDKDVINNEWCRKYEILNGGHYLRLWIASILRTPFDPLPYLFIFGDQNIGKSTLHEMLPLLFKQEKGVARCDHALTNQQGFNGELYGAVINVVEEVNLQKSVVAAERIKDWVTGKQIAIHNKGETVKTVPNTSHWIQCANDASFCPIFPGDTRITVIEFTRPSNNIPKHTLLQQLKEEVAAFLHQMLSITIPESDGRLKIPALSSSIKYSIEQSNQDDLTNFLNTSCTYDPGCVISFADFYSFFLSTLDDRSRFEWSTHKVGRRIPTNRFPKGIMTSKNTTYIGNISLPGRFREQRFDGPVVITSSGQMTGVLINDPQDIRTVVKVNGS